MNAIGVAAAVAAAAIVALELLLRAYCCLRDGRAFFSAFEAPTAKSVAFEPHPYALYVKRPGSGGPYPSNNLGYGGTRALARAKAPGTVRIYCVGGSTTEQHDPKRGPNSSWPGQLQDLFTSRVPPVAVECVNAAAAGYTSAESLAEFLFRGVDVAPDVLLIYHNVNDAWTCQMVPGFRADYSHARRHKPWTLGWTNRLPQLRHLRLWEVLRSRMTERFGKAQSLLYWIADPPWEAVATVEQDATWAFRRNVTSLVAAAKAWGCTPVLIKWECDWANLRLPPLLTGGAAAERAFRECLERNNAALREIAREAGDCGYLDVGPFETRHFEQDSIHFTGEGLTEMARRVADALQPILATTAAARQMPLP